MVDFFNKHFAWTRGEYVMRIRVAVEPTLSKPPKTYRFTLFESDARDLSAQTDDYRFGMGIVEPMHPDRRAFVLVPIVLHRIN